MIETLDDIIEQLADNLGTYGAHDDRCENLIRACRCCWTARLKSRIIKAVEVERKLYGDVKSHQQEVA